MIGPKEATRQWRNPRNNSWINVYLHQFSFWKPDIVCKSRSRVSTRLKVFANQQQIPDQSLVTLIR